MSMTAARIERLAVGEFIGSGGAIMVCDLLSSPVMLRSRALTMVVLAEPVGLPSRAASADRADSCRSNLLRFGQFVPQLIALRKLLSPTAVWFDLPACRGCGEDETINCANAWFFAPVGVIACEPLKEKRSQSSIAGSACGDFKARESCLTLTAGAATLDELAGDDVGEELRARFLFLRRGTMGE